MARAPGSRKKLRDYLVEHVGEVLSSDTLRAVAGTSEWARRVRELRDEEGFAILTHNDRADLRPGEYLLTTLMPRPAFARAFVLDRNGFTCQSCGAVAGEPHPTDPAKKTRLHIGHIIDKSEGGTDEPENLRALCSVCNEGLANLSLPRPPAERLLIQLRRAAGNDQRRVLAWLIQKYPQQAKALLAEQEQQQ